MIINKTESFCCDCQTRHEALIVSENKEVFFVVRCPRAEKSVRISTNVDVYLKIREKSHCTLLPTNLRDQYAWLNIVEITNDCNLTCPVCYANAGDGRSDYLPMEEILDRARFLKTNKRRAVTLSGGEPTLHPQIFEIIRNIRNLRLDVTMVTNAVLLGEDRMITKKLKKSGLTYCYLQFDTFKKEVHTKIRGNDNIENKIKAIENANRARISFGILTTVIRDNLDETGEIIRFATGFAPSLAIVGYLAAVPAGRYQLSDTDLVDREEIIDSLLRSGVVEGLTVDNFWPFPKFVPLGLDIHPDCGVLLYLAVNKGKIEPLERYVNIGRLYRLMAKATRNHSLIVSFLLFNIYFLLSIRFKMVFSLVMMIIGLMTKKGRRSILIVSIEQYMNEIYQDQQRVDHCTACNVLTKGVTVPVCIFNHPDPRRHAYTRSNIDGG